MPATWRTLWGNAFHGLWVTWYNEPSASGEPVLRMTFDVNYYMKKVVACDSSSNDDCVNPWGTPDMDMNSVSNDVYKNTDDTTDFLIYLAWAAPESASTECTVCYDSVDAKVRLSVLAKTSAYHLWNAYWAPRYSDNTSVVNVTGCCKDPALNACIVCAADSTLPSACDKSFDD